MKTQTKLITAVLAIILLGSCQDYNQLVKNPNLALTAPPSLLLTGVLNNMNDDNAWSNFNSNQFWISTYTYYGTNNYDQGPFIGSSFGYYTTLENVVRMEIEAKNAGAPDVNPYSALGKFFRAYYYHVMSEKFGDLPQSEALKGSLNTSPVYDTQHDIYVQILAWLDQANSDLAANIAAPVVPLNGDIFLGNDLSAWQKVVNTFTLRVLVSLSKKSADATLNVPAKFAAILADPAKYPIMTGLGDDLKYTFNLAFNNYPKNPGNIGFNISRENISSVFLDITKSLNDPRTFVTSTPAPALLATHTFDQQAAYAGASPGDDMGTLGGNAQAGDYSYVNGVRYYTTYDGANAEPAIIIGYPEMCFNIAEGINRGWAPASPITSAQAYTNGITAAMENLGVTDGASITVADFHLTPYGQVIVDLVGYMAQASVLYQGDNATGLNQILTQKYLAFWQNSNWEPFFNQRRTGVPDFAAYTGPGTGNGGAVPKRWQYPYAEATANETNYKDAVQRQFAGTDGLNGALWIDQP